jgi:PAS domain S-box-containing protein
VIVNYKMNSNIPETIFVGDSEMARRMRSHDWSQTSLGSPEQWSQSLKTAVRIMVTSRQAMFVWWGEDLINLYNDAYQSILGGKHPQAFGQPAAVVWREIWDQVGPRAEIALRQNQGTYDEALLLIMERNGYPEETYYTFSYSPVPNDDGSIGGIICANTDDTPRIIGERQLALLKELAANTADARTFDAACRLSASCLATNPYDLPFALIYLIDSDRQRAVLAGTSGIEPGHPIAPEWVTFDQDSVWPFAEVIHSQQIRLFSLDGRLPLPTGAWPRSPHQAVAVPLGAKRHSADPPSERMGKAAILIVGLNPFRLFDDHYRGFIDLVSAQIAASIANAQAYEEERKRAEALAELDRAKTTFFNNVSHEFRTPLTLMLGPLENALVSLEEGEPGSQEAGIDLISPALLYSSASPTASSALATSSLKEQLQLAQRNGLRLLKLVNTLLDFSRIEAGRIEAVYEPTDLAALTTELASMFRSTIEQAGLRLVVDCPPLPEPTYVDREMWEKIVLNLLSNAFKFTFEGEIGISLRWGAREPGSKTAGALHFSFVSPPLCSSVPFVILEVRDTGIGIPAEELPHIFKRFHRVKGARGRSYEGSGIGLSLVQELVRLHGGIIEVNSTVEQGTCFILSIPTGRAHLPDERITATRTLTSTATGAMPYLEEALRWLPEKENGEPRMGNREKSISSPSSLPLPSSARILLADDNADMRNYLTRLLSQQYDVEAVADGRAALAAIRDQIPDLVLADVMMPELNGFGLLQALRADPQTQELPIILLSARAGEEARIEGLEAGADDYLTKPFSARELLARVEANLKMARLRQEAAHREQVLRLEAEAAKQSAEAAYERINQILECMTDAFVAFDRQWNYIYANLAALQLLQKSADELIGKNVWEVFPSEVGGLAYQKLHQALEEQISVSWEEFGEPIQRWLEIRAYPSPEGIALYFRDISERKQAEQTLADERAQFEAVLRQMPAGVMIADAASGHLVLSNEQANHILGYTYDLNQELEDYEPNVPFQAYCADGRRYAAADYPLVRSLQTGEVVNHEEMEICYQDGRCIFIDANSSPVFNSQGQLISAVAIFQDITQRKQTEQALRIAEERLRVALQNAPIIVFNQDDELKYTWIHNPVLYELGEMLGKHDRDYLPPEDAEPLTAIKQRVLDTGESAREEVKITRDETSYYYDLTVEPLRDDSNTIIGITCAAIDVSELKRTEVSLRISEARFRGVVESNMVGIVFWEASGCITDANEMAIQMLGYSREDLQSGQIQWQAITPPEFHEIDAAMQAQLLAEGVCPPFEKAYIRKDGTSVPILIGGALLPGYTDRGVAYFLDITDRKQAEAEREQLLAREQAAREVAEAANRIKDEFLAVVSHELRSPLNPILGWAKLLRTRQLDEQKTERALEVIERNAQMQSQLINDLLDVSRILRGKLNLETRPVDLVAIIQAAMETVRLAAEAKSIQIHTQLEPDVGLVSGNAGRLQQVIWNLLSNAVKFTSEGGQVGIRLTKLRGTRSGGVDQQQGLAVSDSAQITVTDTGKGIPAEFLPYVFDQFRQESSATTRRFGGLGLGLAIVRYLVELHGGTVQAESLGEGQGATFTVKLPLMVHDATPPPESPPSEPSLNLQGIRIVVVDDDDNTREFLAFLLELHGANVIATASATEAVTTLAQFQPDVLISDIGMPDMDGYMLMRQIRALPPEQGGQIPTIALTAYAGELNQQQALQAGFQRHLVKPIEPEALIQAIAELQAPGNG